MNNLDKYNKIYTYLQESITNGTLSHEEASSVEDLAYRKYIMSEATTQETNDLQKIGKRIRDKKSVKAFVGNFNSKTEDVMRHQEKLRKEDPKTKKDERKRSIKAGYKEVKLNTSEQDRFKSDIKDYGIKTAIKRKKFVSNTQKDSDNTNPIQKTKSDIIRKRYVQGKELPI